MATIQNFSQTDLYFFYTQHSRVEPTGVSIDTKYKIESLADKESLELHRKLAAQPRSELTTMHLFDLENDIFRRIYKNPSKADLFRCPALNDKIDVVLRKRERPIFHLTNSDQIRRISDLQIQGKPSPNQNNRPIKVVSLSLENARNPVGGVGAVAMGLLAAHQKLQKKSVDAVKVFSLHPLYTQDKLKGCGFEFQGIIAHQYEEQIVESAIYKNKTDQEYVIEPDPRFRYLFNIPQAEGVYLSNQYSNAQDRVLYLGSAAAAFVSLYRGKLGDKSVDVLKFDATSVAGCSFPLLNDVYDSVRQQVGLERVKRVVVWHDGRLEWTENCPVRKLKKIGLDIKNAVFTKDLMATAIEFADRVVFVSPNTASRALSPDPLLNMNRRPLLDLPGKVVAIRNAARIDQFDVTNREIFGDLALERTFDSQGIETTDYISYRNKLKELLHTKGIIADPKLPLVVFVGRYVKEKGIDILVEMVKASKDLGVQFVVMGCDTYEQHFIDELQEMEKTSHKNCLRVYTTMDKQKSLVAGSVKMVQIVRGAADLYTMPSHTEGLPLVAMEGQAPGSLFIAPYHLGFIDICQPEGFDNGQGGVFSLKRDANAICYRDHKSSSQAIAALKQAISTWTGMQTDEEQNKLARRLRNTAVSNFSWYHESPETNSVTGQVIRYQKLYEDLAKSSKPESKPPVSENKVQMVAPYQPATKHLSAAPQAPTLKERVKQILMRLFLFAKRCSEALAVVWCFFYLSIRNKLKQLYNKEHKTTQSKGIA
jgi:glycosyltransferase involved in cell wall biosynthesis